MTASKRGRKPKYLHTIILDGINAREIYKKYKQNKREDPPSLHQPQFTQVLEYSNKNGDASTTQIRELSIKRAQVNIFFDAQQNGRNVTMLDYITFGCLPDCTDLCCANDHHGFNTSPIGIPIQYVRRKPDKIQPDSNKIVGTNDYFLTHNIVCSWPCGIKFIEDHKHLSLYRNSKSLFYSMYYKIYKTELMVDPAHSYECLKEYGGPLTIEKYREMFCKCNFIITENIKRPLMVAVGKYIDEQKCGYI
jgi:hypothetical protein